MVCTPMNTASSHPARLYLASASPRRSQLLTQLGVTHTVLDVPSPPGEDEPRLAGEDPQTYVLRTARDKAVRATAWVAGQALPRLPILTADTTVALGDRILGKPVDLDDAALMLAALAGTRHVVRTAIVVVGTDGTLHTAESVTQVQMAPLTSAQITRYCASGEPLGKAGAYGIQGLAGAFIARIDGSYTGVMGLPLHETADLLAQVGLAPL